MEIDSQELTAQVLAAVAAALQIPPEQVTPDLAFGDLPQWDSMGHMEVMMQFEQDFDIEVNADTIAQLTSIPAITAYLQNGRKD